MCRPASSIIALSLSILQLYIMDQAITLTTYRYTAAKKKNVAQVESSLYMRQQGIELPDSPQCLTLSSERLGTCGRNIGQLLNVTPWNWGAAPFRMQRNLYQVSLRRAYSNLWLSSSLCLRRRMMTPGHELRLRMSVRIEAQIRSTASSASWTSTITVRLML